MTNEEAFKVDIKEDRQYEGYEFYTEVGGIKFYIKSKIVFRRRRKNWIENLRAGRFRRREFYPRICKR